ncbi:MAG: hypothetical protein MUC65_11185 [Pontiellaceae bacterium]|nr:hypothetical protein [Pontiellaceae bacterium]
MKHSFLILAILSTLSTTAFAQTGASNAKDASVVQTPATKTKPIAIQQLDLVPRIGAAAERVETREVLPGEIKEVATHLVSIQGPGRL